MRFASSLLLITSVLDSAALREDSLSLRADPPSSRADPPSSRADSLLLRADSLSLRVNLYHPHGFSISPSPLSPRVDSLSLRVEPLSSRADSPTLSIFRQTMPEETTDATSFTKFFTILCEAMREKQQNTPKRHQLDNISRNLLSS